MQRKYTKEKLEKAVACSTTMADVLRYLGVSYISGSLQSHLKRKIKDFGIDTTHMATTSRGWKKGLESRNKKSPSDLLIRLSPDVPLRTKTLQLRRALIEIGRKMECEECGQGDEW